MAFKQLVALIHDDNLLAQQISDSLEEHSFWKFQRMDVSIEKFFEEVNPVFPPDILLLATASGQTDNLPTIPKLTQFLPNLAIVVLIPKVESGILAEVLKMGVHGIYDQEWPLSELWKAMAYAKIQGDYLDTMLSIAQLNTLYPSEKTLAQVGLLPLEQEVVLYLLQGYSYPMIAKVMQVDLNVIRNYIKSIYKKLDIHTKEELFRQFPLGH